MARAILTVSSVVGKTGLRSSYERANSRIAPMEQFSSATPKPGAAEEIELFQRLQPRAEIDVKHPALNDQCRHRFHSCFLGLLHTCTVSRGAQSRRHNGLHPAQRQYSVQPQYKRGNRRGRKWQCCNVWAKASRAPARWSGRSVVFPPKCCPSACANSPPMACSANRLFRRCHPELNTH